MSIFEYFLYFFCFSLTTIYGKGVDPHPPRYGKFHIETIPNKIIIIIDMHTYMWFSKGIFKNGRRSTKNSGILSFFWRPYPENSGMKNYLYLKIFSFGIGISPKNSRKIIVTCWYLYFFHIVIHYYVINNFLNLVLEPYSTNGGWSTHFEAGYTDLSRLCPENGGWWRIIPPPPNPKI